MRSTSFVASCLAAVSSFACAELNHSKPLLSKQVLPGTFTPPQVFKNNNLVRNINLDKSYPRETINIVIENVDAKPQSEYYLPFESSLLANIGGFEVRDKKDASKGIFDVEVVGYDADSSTEFYKIHLPEPLAPQTQQTISITYAVLSSLQPVPAQIAQTDKQYLQYTFSAYTPSAYLTEKQRTKLKFPTSDVPDYTSLPAELNEEQKADPQKQGSSFTYGQYTNVPAGAQQPVSVRYEFTKPLTHATLLERDLEVSHWGGNLASEERYWLVNQGAGLKNHFSRVEWQKQSYMNPPTFALKGLSFFLRPGAVDPYFTDDIGNVSTSKFRSGNKEALLELKPRYPVFGQWKYSFRVGWNAELATYLRKLSAGDTYALRVPFLEGPRANEGVSYARVNLRVILPEGATNVKFQTTVPIVSNSTSLHRTFMDTLGRTTLELTAINLVDDFRDRDLVVTYDYPWTAGYRKPVVITLGMFALFSAIWVLGSIDTSIGKSKKA
ncbi:dolichyl-diphosphooligosaccharide--protein glycosyltransferase subunit 1 [Parastagonospora nodorum]|nr:dolichyl-diphosphooligosaccharide--protein glycosyltransferase subunit 1 [Parastagonospora nodorum]KAH4243103.1 dolichyl-diphosphooligosaccharide--protein glycosyltransferase subunit 1 [Parastagonospora nodorum]KAH4973591.1 dolichyl-diphosphooligosaccharide--protein glycosyltransferase subunit 1 [Parastagonospora nodorum]KAH6331414.1 dolichyl-diphosphooligosaccharide--protein glycosyltransferase subunit 1 [Parastagonospora nodorum]